MNRCCHVGISGFGHNVNCHVRETREEGREWDDDDFLMFDDDSETVETENDCDD